jgi:UDP-GlcNAc:undecaprenyl-phosphate/decaprenyl-phosphate GlcNAc-1-phosphate transferase
MTSTLLAFAIALLASLFLTAPVRQLALRIGMVDQPGPRKVHLAPIPLLGGLAMYCGVVLAVLIAMEPSARSQMVGIFLGATVVAFVGILDDGGLLHHQVKLFLGMPAAALILIASGVRMQFFETVHPGSHATVVDGVLTLFWIVGITASFSIFDHMDGLCAGIAAIASFFFAVYAYREGQPLVLTLAAAVMGASLGFLRWNFKPAKIFMGDGGAMFVGFLMATLGAKMRFPNMHHRISWIVPLLILGVPIFDTTLVTVSRTRRGLIPFATPGKDHTAHRLSNLGLGQRGAVLALYGTGAILGLLALALGVLPLSGAYVVAALAVLVSAAGVFSLESAPYERQRRDSPRLSDARDAASD